MKEFNPETETNECKYTIGNPPQRKLLAHSRVSFDRTMSLLAHGPQTLETLNAINWDHKGVGQVKPYGTYCLINGWIKEADMLEESVSDDWCGTVFRTS